MKNDQTNSIKYIVVAIVFVIGILTVSLILEILKSKTQAAKITELKALINNNENNMQTVQNNKQNHAEFNFENRTHDFGTIKKGQLVEHIFEFVNSGSEILIIAAVTPSCGCTSPEYSTNPVAPGEKGYIKVIFDSETKMGNTSSIVSITANTKKPITNLTMKGYVNE